MSSTSVKIRYENLRTLSFGGISGTYAGVGAAFANPVRILKITNTTDVTLTISFDGVNDKDVVASSSAWIHDYGTNRAEVGGQLDQAQGERVYVKGAPTLGTVYVTVIYASAS